jgi:hypothetical protein
MDINTLLPDGGTGFVTFNRGNNGEFQFGQQSTIDAVLAVGEVWNEDHSEQLFSVGHISKKGGGNFDPPHKSHKLGVDVDVRPLRKDKTNQSVTISQPAFDQPATAELIALWWRFAPVQLVFFNDPEVIAAGNSQFLNGHHNHFHVRLRMKDDPLRIGDRGSDVAEVQTLLEIEVDGKFGPDTLHAVEDFQTAHGINPTGVVGPKTWAALRAL